MILKTPGIPVLMKKRFNEYSKLTHCSLLSHNIFARLPCRGHFNKKILRFALINKAIPFRSKSFLLFFALVIALWNPAISKTRWSSLHLIPDADFLANGQFVIDAEGYFFQDSAKGFINRPTALLNIGIMEWVNLEAGYAGGFTLGFKARLLGENSTYLPSLAIGARNIISHKELNYFAGKDTMNSEFYLALAKTVDPLRLRIHLGIKTIPSSKKDQADPFIALEEYFGMGLYTTLEIERLKGAFWPSLFASWRILGKRIEISAGAVAINRLFFDKNNKFNVSFTSTDSIGFVRPGIWFSIRYCGMIKSKGRNIFQSIDDKIAFQEKSVETLQKEMDSLKKSINENKTLINKIDNTILILNDSLYSDKSRLKAALYDKLVALKILYETEPFEPEQIRQSTSRIVAIKDNALPILKEFIIDKKQDRKIRMLCISLIGEMGGTGASDALLDVLSQSEDQQIKIEILISLGKMKETRAIYVMEQLANDPIDVVAFTAQEVLQNLVREKGIKLDPDFKMRHVAMPESTVIKEEKIPISQTGKSKQTNDSTYKKLKEKNNNSLSNEVVKTDFKNAISSTNKKISSNEESAQLKNITKIEKENANTQIENVKDTGDIWKMHSFDRNLIVKNPSNDEKIETYQKDTNQVMKNDSISKRISTKTQKNSKQEKNKETNLKKENW